MAGHSPTVVRPTSEEALGYEGPVTIEHTHGVYHSHHGRGPRATRRPVHLCIPKDRDVAEVGVVTIGWPGNDCAADSVVCRIERVNRYHRRLGSLLDLRAELAQFGRYAARTGTPSDSLSAIA